MKNQQQTLAQAASSDGHLACPRRNRVGRHVAFQPISTRLSVKTGQGQTFLFSHDLDVPGLLVDVVLHNDHMANDHMAILHAPPGLGLHPERTGVPVALPPEQAPNWSAMLPEGRQAGGGASTVLDSEPAHGSGLGATLVNGLAPIDERAP